MGDMQHLQLDTSYSNPLFSSWRLQGAPALTPDADLPLPARLPKLAETDGSDYLHLRAALLHNSLTKSAADGNLTCILDDNGGRLALYEVQTDASSGKNALQRIARFWNAAHDQEGEQLLEAVNVFYPSSAQVSRQPATSSRLWVVSSGAGDLQVVSVGSNFPNALHPLKHQGTERGIEPFSIAAAYQAAPGVVDAIVWSIASRAGSQPSHCPIHLVRLAKQADASDTSRWAVLATQQLTSSKLPPCVAVAGGTSASSQLVVGLDTSDISSTRHVNGAGAGPLLGSADDDDISPRTLRAASERLAQYTTGEEGEGANAPRGAVRPSERWADVFAEPGGTDPGVLDPDCVLISYRCGEAAPGPLATEVGRLACAPHKVLASCSDGAGGAWLGLAADDIDCAVIHVTCQGPEGSIGAMHCSSVPALAYIAAGKVNRKFLLLGGPDAPIAAVIVESNRYAYVYFKADASAAYGRHEVLDLGLSERGEGVAGAALKEHSGAMQLLIMTSTAIKTYNVAGG